MGNFEKIIEKETSQDLQQKPLEIPDEIKEVQETTDMQSQEDTSDVTSAKDVLDNANIQASWTTINTSRHGCGCNNACFNSCFNIG